MYTSALDARAETSTRVRKTDNYGTEGVRYIIHVIVYIYTCIVSSCHTHLLLLSLSPSYSPSPHLYLSHTLPLLSLSVG